MSFRYRVVAALMLATCAASCGDSNPFVGTWVLADGSKSDVCMKTLEITENLQITEKTLRSKEGGIRLYTLIEDGDDYIFDTKRKPKIVAKVGKDDTIILDTGAAQCTMQRQKSTD
jgi:hypothetical protein